MFEIKNIINDNFKKQKAYFNEDGSFRTSRCRIEPRLFSSLIFDYLFTDQILQSLCEKYLEVSRRMNKVKKDFKNSKGMDSNALINWLNIERKTKFTIELSDNEEKIKKLIDEYINKIFIDESNLSKKSKLFNKWDIYYNQFIKDYKNYRTIIKTFKKRDYKISIIEEKIVDDYKELKDEFHFNSTKPSKVIDKIKKEVGIKGEDIVFDFLKKQYSNILHISKFKPYYPYDIEINNGSEKIYVEVKSTKDPVKNNFIISRNEFNFYKKHNNNYWLAIVKNLDPFNNDNDIQPYVTIIKNPNIQYSKDIVGFKDNKIYITTLDYSNF